jgi:drug/metabolite transporter (DMT)-like permease
VTIPLAIVFLKERVTRVRGLGMFAAVAGIVITAL